ncbi:hypothetical protein [Poseidonibacter ostreae]|uniref:Uncharacterized protein n=1 Tax=Poseidonibacter ostreae TaxID=2654171 RepID=A0A6L4WWP4_9BACT|nr:hypothetical protein [Poseidonibacter ostreae]KAB7891277.1 hypothetical protein GBG19_00140 [Poseidonibacter ostreae]
MGKIRNKSFDGKIVLDDKNNARYIGKDNNGKDWIINILGKKEKGQATKLNYADFIKEQQELVVQSSSKAIEYALSKGNSTKAKAIEIETKARLKSIKSGEFAITINSGTAIYSPKSSKFYMNALGSAVKMEDNKTFYNLKLVENNKNGKNTLSVENTFSGMAMKREEFSKLSDDEKQNISYNPKADDAKNWRYKKLNLGDLELGNVDFSTVRIDAKLNNRQSTVKDLIEVFKKDANYIDYVTTKHNKEFRASYTDLKSSSGKEYVFPKTKLSVAQGKIFQLAEVNNLKELVKKVLVKADERLKAHGKEFFIPFVEDDKQIRVNSANIDSINKQMLSKSYKALLSQFENKVSNLIKFVDADKNGKDYDSTMKYLDLVDDIKNAPTFKEYANTTKTLLRQVKNDSLSNAPINVYFPLKTADYAKSENIDYKKRVAQEMKSMTNGIKKDILSPIKKDALGYLLSETDSKYVNTIRENLDKFIELDMENKKLNYKADEKGFTALDRMPLSVIGNIENEQAYENNGVKYEPLGFKAINIPNNLEKEAFVGLKGVGGREFEYPKLTSVYKELFLQKYIAPQQSNNATVDLSAMPSLTENPLTGKTEKTTIVDKTVETVAPETATPETVVPETATPETVAPETVAPEIVTVEKTDEELEVDNLEIDDLDTEEEIKSELGQNVEVDNAPIPFDESKLEVVNAEEMKEETSFDMDFASMGMDNELGIDTDLLNDFLNDDFDMGNDVPVNIKESNDIATAPSIETSELAPQ